MKVNIYDLLNVYEKEISKNCKNKRKVYLFDIFKMENISYIKYMLENNLYIPSKYNIFIVRDPKYRIVMSLTIKDKIVNHYLARYILIPKLDKYLDNRIIATRTNMGSSYGIKLIKKYLEKYKKYDKFYILKIDIKKYFYNIDHEVLKGLLIDKLTEEEYNLICKIINSTNSSYVNESIDKCSLNELKKRSVNKEKINDLARYKSGKGLSLGAMTSQFLSIYYLHSLIFFIVHKLGLTESILYMDDLIIFHQDKAYLKKCLEIIKNKLKDEYKLNINLKKTFIIDSNNSFSFLGYTFFVRNKKTIIKVRKETISKVRKRVLENNYLYKNNLINFSKYFSSLNTYLYSFKYASNYKVRLILEKMIVE